MDESSYRSSFDRWDEQAWVRSKPHRLTPFVEGLRFYPPELCPLFAHPEVTDAPANVQDRILIHHLYIFLEFTVRLETGPVNEVCAMLRSPRFLPRLPTRMKDDALRIYTDEAGHAEMTHGLMAAVRDSTGVPPPSHEPRFERELARLRAAAPPSLRSLTGLFFVIVSETLITGTLTELPRARDIQPAVRAVAGDHAADEARHHAFFHRLFELVWPDLPERTRRHIGMALPKMVLAFLASDEPALVTALASSSERFTEPERIVTEVADGPTARTRLAREARPTLRMLRRAGVLDDPEIADAFRRHGLLREQPAGR